ncbi:MAG: CDP-alcohol phosphatidyltransferase family protein [Candidatus Paceibacterota bacterium]|jgi:phosphatidylglycerophosphate synthase
MRIIDRLSIWLTNIYRFINSVFRESIKPFVPAVKAWIQRHKERREDKREDRIFRILNFRIMGEEVVTVPNVLSALRPILALLLLPMRYYGVPLTITAPIFAIALLTDKYDGVWAEQDGHTNFGEFLDPICDKIALFIFVLPDLAYLNSWIIWPLFVIELVLFTVSIGAMISIHLGGLKKSTNLSSNIFGKTKFTMECVALCALAIGFIDFAGWFFAIAIPFALLSILGKAKELMRAHYHAA